MLENTYKVKVKNQGKSIKVFCDGYINDDFIFECNVDQLAYMKINKTLKSAIINALAKQATKEVFLHNKKVVDQETKPDGWNK